MSAIAINILSKSETYLMETALGGQRAKDFPCNGRRSARISIMDLKYLIFFISSAVFLFTAGCTKTTDEPFSCDTKVDFVIEDCNERVKHETVPVAVLPFTDEREYRERPASGQGELPELPEGELITVPKGCQWQQCAVRDFNQVVTKAFESTLRCSDVDVTDADNAALFLSGKITKFEFRVCVDNNKPKEGDITPLEVELELKDADGTVVWTKTAGDENIKLPPYPKIQSFRSKVYVTDRYIILFRKGEPWTVRDVVWDFTRDCVLSAVNDLVTDEAFWNVVKPQD
jgi:hypothetical protein